MASPGIESAAVPDKGSGAGLQAGMRRHITVMFTDVVGFTTISEQIGEEDTFDLVRRIAAEQADAIRVHGGVLQDFAGDGLMAIFGVPIALEDACLRACRTAIEIQHRMRRLEPEFNKLYGVRPQLRIGVHTGTAVVGQIGQHAALAYNVLGDNVNIAARIQAAAEPGTIYLSQASLDLVQGFIDATPIGETSLKGKSELVNLFRLDLLRGGVTRFGAKLSQGLTPLQERANELSLLEQLWSEVSAGRARTADVIGEAGIGKSRLLFEFEESLHDKNALVLAAASSSEEGATPFFPLIELIRGSLGLNRDADRAVISGALSRALDNLNLDHQKVFPYLLDLLAGVDPEAPHTALPASELVGVRTRDALVELIQAWGRGSSPAVLVVEDLHWIDTGSQDVLTAVISTLSTERLLILCSYRPEYIAPWRANPSVVRLRLDRLHDESAIALVKDRLAGKVVADDLIATAVAKAEGNPLFAEEIAAYLAERAIRLPGKAPTPDIPSSLENLIMDRVHRLEPEAVQLLQTASVVGRRFAVDLVTDVSELNGKVPSLLAGLVEKGILLPVRSNNTASEDEYSFKHVLMQDALYASLLSGARGAAHEKTGLYLETKAGLKTPEIADLLAHHFTRTKRSDRAVRYLAMAADKSLRLFSLKEALSYLEQALALIERDSTCAHDALIADVLVNRLLVCCWESDFANMVPLGQKYLPRLERLGPSRQLSRVLAWMGEGYLNSERFNEAEQILNRALSIGREINCDESTAYALWDIMWLHLLTPDGRSQDRYFELGDQILTAAKRLNDPYLETLTYYTLCADALQRGFLAEAQTWANRSIALGEGSGYPPALSLGFMSSSFVAAVGGNGSAALELAQKAHDASAGATERVAALCARGLAQLSAGQPVESFGTLQEFNRLIREAGFLGLLVVSEVPEAAARAFAGDPAGAIADLEASIARFRKWRNARIVAWAHLVLGQIYLAAASAEKPCESSSIEKPGSLVKAEHHLVEAAAIARVAGVKGFLLQALTTMADAGLGQFKGPQRAASLADARSIAVEIGALPAVEHIDAISARAQSSA